MPTLCSGKCLQWRGRQRHVGAGVTADAVLWYVIINAVCVVGLIKVMVVSCCAHTDFLLSTAVHTGSDGGRYAVCEGGMSNLLFYSWSLNCHNWLLIDDRIDGRPSCMDFKWILNICISAVSMWYSYISIDIDRYFTKYLDIDRYRYTRHCSQTEWCKDPVQHLPIPLPAINRLQKVFTFVLNVVFH